MWKDLNAPLIRNLEKTCTFNLCSMFRKRIQCLMEISKIITLYFVLNVIVGLPLSSNSGFITLINYYSSNQVLFKLLSCDSTKLRVDVLRLATELRQLRFLLSPFHFVLYQKIYLAIKRSLHKSKYVKYIFVSFYYDFHYFLNLTDQFLYDSHVREIYYVSYLSKI